MVICLAENLGSVIEEVNRFEVLDITVTVVISCFKLFILIRRQEIKAKEQLSS